jgi:hypothetical protein
VSVRIGRVTGSREGLALDWGRLREPAQKLWH